MAKKKFTQTIINKALCMLEKGKTMREISEKLGASTAMICKWRQDYNKSVAKTNDELLTLAIESACEKVKEKEALTAEMAQNHIQVIPQEAIEGQEHEGIKHVFIMGADDLLKSDYIAMINQKLKTIKKFTNGYQPRTATQLARINIQLAQIILEGTSC